MTADLAAANLSITDLRTQLASANAGNGAVTAITAHMTALEQKALYSTLGGKKK